MPSFDAIVIGGGTNGLACAARLQKSGRKVLVLESGAEPGGAALGHEFAPGYRAPGLAHIVNMIDARVEREMDLGRHGLAYASLNMPSTAVATDGDHLVLEGGAGERVTGLSEAEQRAWGELRTQLLTFAGVLAPFKAMTPPRIAAGVGNEYMKLGKLGFSIRGMGRDNFREFLRMLLINVYDVLNDELTDPRLKGLLAHDAVLGTWLGPRSPNSLIHLLNRLSGQVAGRRAAIALPKGGMGSVAVAMARSAEALGVTVRSGAQVSQIVMDGDRAVGVVLADGEEIRAGTVVSAIGPKATFLGLVGPRHLDTGFVNRVRHMKARVGAATFGGASTAETGRVGAGSALLWLDHHAAPATPSPPSTRSARPAARSGDRRGGTTCIVGEKEAVGVGETSGGGRGDTVWWPIGSARAAASPIPALGVGVEARSAAAPRMLGSRPGAARNS